jgi:putative component of toxin-antitoxin plasmid stabilization module
MSYKVVEYLREDGTSPYEEWFMGLDTVAAAKITTVKLKMEQGNLSNVKWFRGIGEYRLWIGGRAIESISAVTVRD